MDDKRPDELSDITPAPEVNDENLQRESIYASVERFLLHTFGNKPFALEEAQKLAESYDGWLIKPKPGDIQAAINWFNAQGLIKFDPQSQKYTQRM